MNTDEKREALQAYCDSKQDACCDGCFLDAGGNDMFHCLVIIDEAPDWMIDAAHTEMVRVETEDVE